ncbi:uncharacterized protein [Misgurnus anguillicaudatus]|uniref:uncharacterized protein isoform X1 n=1 Tax=Misgurnus anguillicaudatus TaxID=75329 RepID=UPI003CCF049E
MDSGDSKENESQVRRRSNRLSSPAVFSLADPKHKPLLGRKRKANKDDAPSRAVNGSKEVNSLAEDEDEEPPVKSPKRQKESEMAENGNDRGDGDQADVEMDDNVDQDTDMDSEEEAEEDNAFLISESRRGFKLSADVQEENLEPGMSLRSRRSIHETEDTEPTKHHHSLKTTFIERSSMGAVPVQLKPLENLKGLSRRRYLNDQDHTQEKTRASTKPLNDYTPRPALFYRPAEANRNLIVLTNNLPTRKQVPQLKNTELKNLKKPLTSRATPTSTSKGCTWYMWKLLLMALILVFLALGFYISHSFMLRTDVVQPNIQENLNADMAALQLLYPSQRSVFWKRSVRHLQGHLQTVNPTEPVSLILTGGLKAERTLACLARSLATAYSVSLNNGSILEIDGTTKTGQDSDQVKLDIDTALRKAFDGNKSAAVIHRFEELPPGSTLIFYRYCDHENAAYKKVFLVFTVMLSVDKIETDSSLSAVEDMVHDQIKEKFVTPNKSAMFNQMDVDKLSGLWSRISHVILPVAAEEKTEREGCGS